jgi:hypothetical protein
VIIRISADPIAPPTIETVAMRHSEIDGSPNAADARTDRTASHRADENVVTTAT